MYNGAQTTKIPRPAPVFRVPRCGTERLAPVPVKQVAGVRVCINQRFSSRLVCFGRRFSIRRQATWLRLPMQRCQASMNSLRRPVRLLEYLAPRSLGEVIVLVGQRQSRGFHQRPGDGRAVAQVHRQFRVRRGRKALLAGQAADPAGALRVQRRVLVPELLVAFAGDAGTGRGGGRRGHHFPSADWRTARPAAALRRRGCGRTPGSPGSGVSRAGKDRWRKYRDGLYRVDRRKLAVRRLLF